MIKTEYIGDPNSDLILQGNIKLRWGNKFINLLDSNGNLNVSQESTEIIKQVSKESDMTTNNTLYRLKNDDVDCLVVYFDSKHKLTFEIETKPETLQLPSIPYKTIYTYRNIITKIEQSNQYFKFYLLYQDRIYQEGDTILFYIEYEGQNIPVYVLVTEYDYVNNTILGFVTSQSPSDFDYSLIVNLKNIDCFLYSYKKENIYPYLNEDLVIGNIEGYRPIPGIQSKHNIFNSAQFTYDETFYDSQYPIYTQELIDKLDQDIDGDLENIPANALVPWKVIKGYIDQKIDEKITLEWKVIKEYIDEKIPKINY